MPYFFLPPEDLTFPPAHFADQDGLLAQGGDITAEWLTLGYRNGVYMWASPMEPLKWWSPDPRVVIFPPSVKTMQDIQFGQQTSIQFNSPVKECLDYCTDIENSKQMNPAWVTGQFRQAYEVLEREGLARTCLMYEQDSIIACAIGAQIGKVFFGEYLCGQSDTSVVQIAHLLVQHLGESGVQMIDIDKDSNNCPDIGVSEISRSEYLDLLKRWID